jgi:hypothetical protein
MVISGTLWAKLQRSSKAPQSSGRVKYRTDRAAIQRHSTELRDAGTDEHLLIWRSKIESFQIRQVADLAEVARRFSLSVTAY